MLTKQWKAFCLCSLSLLVAFGIFVPSQGQTDNQQSEPLLLWPELKVEGEWFLQLSRDRQFIAFGRVWDTGMVIRRLRSDWSIGEIVLDTTSRRKERKELEIGVGWMAGNKLLVVIAEGVTDYEELEHKSALHAEDPEKYPLPNFKAVILDPLTGEETLFPVPIKYGAPVIGHPDGDKVLIEQDEATILYSFPEAKELARITVPHSIFLEWCPDKRRFWGLDAYLHEDGLTWTTDIVVTDIYQNQRKVILAREWNNELYSIWLEYIGSQWGQDVFGNLHLGFPEEATLVEGGELAIWGYKTKAGKTVIIYLSPEGIAREREISEEMLPKEMSELGECWYVAMLPNGRELLIRQGRHSVPKNGWSEWQKCWYWLWDMEKGTLKRVGYFDELDIIEWVGPREAVVAVESAKESLFGLLRLP